MKVIFKVLSFLNKFIPKKNNRIVLYSNLGFRDNVESLYRYLISQGYQKTYKIICISNNFYFKSPDKRVKFVGLYRGILYFFTSKYFFYCFGKYPIKPSKKQIVVNLWHGMPLKKIGNLESQNSKKDYNFFTYLLCSSEMFRDVMKNAFHADNSQIMLAGGPRNDDLYNPKRLRNEKLQVVWMPTYRSSELSVEGGESLPFTLSIKNWKELDKFLIQKGICLFIKLHPLEKNLIALDDLKLLNIVVINDKMLQSLKIPTYSFLGGMDALITDYSSVYFDYLLLDRPIGFVSSDADSYSSQRGFVFDEGTLDKIKVGPQLNSLMDLQKFLTDLKNGIDEFKVQRSNLNSKVNLVKKDFSWYILHNLGMANDE